MSKDDVYYKDQRKGKITSAVLLSVA
nr:hypothetical protein [Tanacetum cinerariifolium]